MSLPVSQVERIAYLYANDVPLATIAASVGLSAGRLTQVIEGNEDLRNAIATVQASTIDEDLAKKDKLATIEERLLGTIPALVDECTSLGESMRALQIINDMQQRRRGLAPSNGTGIGAGVQLNLSYVAKQQINVVLSEKRGILSIGGLNVAPMPRDSIEGFLNDLPKSDPASGLPDDDADY